MKRERAIIIGAGLGGLTAALELRRAGFEVDVFERRLELGEVNSVTMGGRLRRARDVAFQIAPQRLALRWLTAGGRFRPTYA